MRPFAWIAIALAVIAALAAAAPASADVAARHTVKHRTHATGHLRVHHRPAGVFYGQPVYLGPAEYPGYRYGGPLYSTCDRINADRMLVGTCR
jgi:hypothetical protein